MSTADRSVAIDVSIVIVTMNHLKKLKNLLTSINKIDDGALTYEVIIIDNCSTDGAPEFVATNYPNVRLVVNSEIHGFAYNNNKGANLAFGKYIFICNPDVVILENALNNLFKFAQQHPDAGIVCPQLLNSDLSYQPSIRGFHSLKIIFARLISKGNDSAKNQTVRAYLLSDFDKNKTQKVDWALGAAMLLKQEYYKKLNGFDEKFFLYVEDEDLCLRSWKLGPGVTYYPESKMIHDHQRGSSKISILTWYHLKSFIYFIVKHNLVFRTVKRD
ncbi:glycosyltransferase family 2 protein [Pedobacter namyangjuensis]|uniref:glycosyltransferase family 2 protein n=1 Tax=Pedobacter namyangjuensis TaxID=600626 RepID=UPI000DE3D223|nr:glycosyltransferase family 2 protein [Pedobacter namyangjuensis]